MTSSREEKGHVISINLSEQTGTIKRPVPEIRIDDRGIAGDAHAGAWHRQVSLLAKESIDRFAAEAGRSFAPGEFAENITTCGLDLNRVGILDRFQIGEVELEVTQRGKACHGDGCAIFREVGRCVMPKEGIFCRVIHGGTVRAGDAIAYTAKVLRFLVITLSDRASRGEYDDRSGPAVKVALETFFRDRRPTKIDLVLIADDSERLRCELQAAREDGVDVVFTTGGTGVGPRDITPDVVAFVADKTIPGIMEHIRVKYGREKPNALLSRSVAAVFGDTLIYTLPGSVKAVREYMGEILKTMEHLMFMVRGLDTH